MLQFTETQLVKINKQNPIVKAILNIDISLYESSFNKHELKGIKNQVKTLCEIITIKSNSDDVYTTYTWRQYYEEATNDQKEVLTESILRFVLNDNGVEVALNKERSELMKAKVQKLAVDGDLEKKDLDIIKELSKSLDKAAKENNHTQEYVVVCRPSDDFLDSYDMMIATLGELYHIAASSGDMATKLLIDKLKDDEYIKNNKLFAEIEGHNEKLKYANYVKI